MIVRDRVEGRHLVGNLLGDPPGRELFVYLPPGYEETDARYPSAYLLHAYGQTAEGLVFPPTERERWSPSLEDVLDPVFGRMGVPPLIVVVPDGTSRWGCSQWVDSPVMGNFEQYVLHDVIAYVDATYRTLPAAQSRGVLGYSSGGFGSWHLASRNPDVFGAMAALSADSWFDLTLKPLLYKYLDSIWPDAPSGPISGNSWSQATYGYSAAYSPNLDNPPFWVDLPVAHPSGELLQQVWERWLGFDPVLTVTARDGNLRRLSGILLDVGVNDDYGVHWGHRLLSSRLSEAGIAHEHRENAGNHGGRSRESWQIALQWMSGVLERAGS